MKNWKKYYTLIELLIVVTLMGVLMGLAMPSFSRLIKGSGKVVATRELTAKINAARSYAVSNRVNVAILFPSWDSISGDITDISDNFKNTSYRVCIAENTSGTWKFASWIDGETWNHLPTGMVFKDVFVNTGSPTYPLSIADCDFSDIDTSKTAVDVKRAIIIKPNGGLYGVGSNTVEIKLAEGVYNSSTGITYTNKVGNQVTVSIMTLNPYTCRITYSDVLE